MAGSRRRGTYDDAGRSETPNERADRNFAEAVQELRVAQTGVQVLFAFLLSLPFFADFPSDDSRVATVYTAALFCAASAAVVFIAPVAFHRLHFRQGLKEQVVLLTHRMAMAGLVLLVAAMALGMWIVLAVLWGDALALVVVAALVVVVLVAWLGVPRLMLVRSDDAERSAHDSHRLVPDREEGTPP